MGNQLIGNGSTTIKEYPTTPAQHRATVTAAEATDPADTTTSVQILGFAKCRFDLDVIGGSVTSAAWQALFWNSGRTKFFKGDTGTITEYPSAIVVATDGADYIYLRCAAIAGGGTVRVDYTLA